MPHDPVRFWAAYRVLARLRARVVELSIQKPFLAAVAAQVVLDPRSPLACDDDETRVLAQELAVALIEAHAAIEDEAQPGTIQATERDQESDRAHLRELLAAITVAT